MEFSIVNPRHYSFLRLHFRLAIYVLIEIVYSPLVSLSNISILRMHRSYFPNLLSHWLLMCSPSVSIWLRISVSLITLNILVSLVSLADLPILIRIALSSCLLLILIVSYTLDVHLTWLIESSLLSIISLLIAVLWWISYTISTAIDKFCGYSAVPIIHFVTVAIDTNLNFASI